MIRPLGCNSRNGFSLTELLVSVLLIGALVGVLLVSLGKVRERSAGVQCVVNLRQIFTGLIAYRSDHNGISVPSTLGTDMQWQGPLDPYLGGRGPSIAAKTVTSRAWLCPKNKVMEASLHRNGSMAGYMTGYLINRHLSVGGKTADGVDCSQGIRFNQVQRPENKVYFVEGCRNSDEAFGPATAVYYTSFGYRGWMRARHGGNPYVVFFDGRVEAIPPSHPLSSDNVTVAGDWWLPAK